MDRFTVSPFLFLLIIFSLHAARDCHEHGIAGADLVKREQRKVLVEAEYGEISAVEISSTDGLYDLQFFTLEPNSLFLPVLLHSHLLFYVHTGSGKLSWTEGGDMRQVDISRGDVYRLNPGSVFFVQSNLDSQRQKLRFFALFSNSYDYNHYQPSIGPYSRLSDMITGFDGKVLQAAFKVSEGTVDEITSAARPPSIVHAVPLHTKKTSVREWEVRLVKSLLNGRGPIFNLNKISKPFNVYDAKPDFENCNGWSLTVNKKNLMKGSNVGVFMVNLTKGSMMGPHWNPMATEVAIVLQGQGMVRIGCPTDMEAKGCESRRFKVEEGDVFVVPRFHPMAQISYNNGSLVFMGFSTWAKKNHPQFVAGKRSVLQVVERDVLVASLNVTESTIEKLLGLQEEGVILECVSCAEEEEVKMEEEIEKRREEEEEARKREEEEVRKREEEEAREREEEERKRGEEEEEGARKREEEEARKREEEEEEARKREEEEARKREEEEEEARKREEEEARKREEEARRKEEEAIKREEEEEAREREEEARKREKEEARKREEEEEAKRREEEEEEEARKREEEAKRREEEEEQARKRKEEEEARRIEEKEEEEARKREEEAKRKEEKEEEARKREEEAKRREEEEEAMKREEEAMRREEEEEAMKREEEAMRRKEEEEAMRREEEEESKREAESEQEAAWREEEERVEKEKQKEEAERERESQNEEEEEGKGGGDEVKSGAQRLRALKLSRFMI